MSAMREFTGLAAPMRRADGSARRGLRRLGLIAAGEASTAAFVIGVVAALVVFRAMIFTSFGDSVRPAGLAADIWQDFTAHLASALLMLLVIEPVRRLGPAAGARRVGALAVSILLAAALAALARSVWLIGSGNDPEETWSSWPVLFVRFALPAALLVIVGEFHRRELQSLEAMHTAEADRAVLEQETLQARLKTLEAQIEPHFLFNILANVRRLYETDAAAGEAMLDQMMRYLQVALPSMRSERATLDREAQLIEAYLELQQVRMGRRLAFRVDIAADLRRIEVPTMMLLTLVENAVKHGLAPQREGGRIEVGARLEGAQLHLEVADTGRGFGSGTSGGGTGLANVRARLSAMFGSGAGLTLQAREPCGLLASIRLPAGAPA
jgi:signal transduction histidine kinase